MRFTDAYLRQLRDRLSIADYAGKKLQWDQRKSRPSAGDFWACCPFHIEKSASFHVLDAKGVFHCFGCGETGDVIGLAMKLEGLSFPEAVSRLAEQAGLPLPQGGEAEDSTAARQRRALYAVLAEAAEFFRASLRGPDARPARDYLRGRGLNEDDWDRFGLGYAPGGWTAAIDALGKRGRDLPLLIAAGLARPGQDGRRPIDTFRERIMFEIADAGGKVIAFGGRTLAKDNPAKYINSPETELFHKGATLYRLRQAREALARAPEKSLILAEGYFDVIAFERAGLAAVAPLGTALTEDQLRLAWRACPEAVFCFDGDGAGRRAAERALRLALPHVGPGRTARLALLPEGEDPDDLFRRAGPEALRAAIAAARAAGDALYDIEVARTPLTTPETQAALKERLRTLAGAIEDRETRRLYLSAWLGAVDALLWEQRRSASKRPKQAPGAPFRPGQRPPAPPTEELRRASLRLTAEDFLREAVDRPSLMARAGEWIDRLPLSDPDLAAIRAAIQALTSADSTANAVDRASLSLHLVEMREERAAARLLRWPRARPPGEHDEEIEAQWLARMMHDVIAPALREELSGLKMLADAGDEAAFARCAALGRALREVQAAALSQHETLTPADTPLAAAFAVADTLED